VSKRVVLAYSGGLDTSVIVRWLADRGFEVITYTADVGQGEELSEIEEKAKMAGAVEAVIDDIKEEFAREYCMPLMRAGALYEDKYPLLSALSRPLISKKLVELAHKVGADYVAHGSTGKGNDQVRFEASVWALDPDIEVLAPVREWEFKSREEEIEYAQKHGIPVVATKEKPYSYDRNLWGVAIESGPLEDPAAEPQEDAFVLTVSPENAPDTPEYLEIEFERGVPVGINGNRYSELWKLVWDLNEMAGKHGFGRIDMIENRLVGIKSREVYESPAGLLLLKAYDEIESMVLDRFTYHYKITHVRHPYSEVVYNGLWFSTLRESLDAFNDNIAKLITGKVKFKLYKGYGDVVGRSAEKSMYIEDLATYSPHDSFDHKAGAAFTKVWSLPLKVAGRVRK